MRYRPGALTVKRPDGYLISELERGFGKGERFFTWGNQKVFLAFVRILS